MGIEGVLRELNNLTPEEKAKLAEVFGAAKQEERKKNPPASPKAGMVYFFKQLTRYGVTEVVKTDEDMKKVATELPERVIAIDEKMASKIFWKQGTKYKYLGRSMGNVWRQARMDGKRVAEAQAMEYEEMIKAPDVTPPSNNEKTFFRGTTLAQAGRGEEISWNAGLKQQG